MRQIVLCISLLITLLGCSHNEDIVTDYNSIASLWSYARRGTMRITEDIYIRGTVVANDRYGELNRAIVVADDSGGVMVELDMDDIANHYPLHSMVQIRCSGLWLGTVGPKLILGAEPTGEFVVDRIPEDMALNTITELHNNDDTPTIRHRNIAELEYRDVLSSALFEGLRLVDVEHGMLWTDKDLLTDKPITTVRHFAQGDDTLRVVTDAGCIYATEPIPTTELSICGVIDWYDSDIALRIVGHNFE